MRKESKRARVARFRRVCAAAGCRYIGVQEGDAAMKIPDLILFNDHNGSSLAIKEDKFSEAAVRRKLAESDARWASWRTHAK